MAKQIVKWIKEPRCLLTIMMLTITTMVMVVVTKVATAAPAAAVAERVLDQWHRHHPSVPARKDQIAMTVMTVSVMVSEMELAVAVGPEAWAALGNPMRGQTVNTGRGSCADLKGQVLSV
jgi:hypothetical protein